jgi:hypothetical protein
MKGYFAMLAFKQTAVPVAAEEARNAQSLAARATARERSHIAALTAWADGELDRAIAVWESILRSHPHDVVAFRLAHFVNFWLGRPQDMVASVERVIPAWSEDIPGFASIRGRLRFQSGYSCGTTVTQIKLVRSVAII